MKNENLLINNIKALSFHRLSLNEGEKRKEKILLQIKDSRFFFLRKKKKKIVGKGKLEKAI